MLQKTRGIVLHQIKYSDSRIIVNIYTEKFGRQSYLIQSVHGKRSKTRANLFQPLFLLDLEVYHKEKREIQKVKETRLLNPFQSIPYDPVKRSIAIFLAEILSKTLLEEEANSALFQFLIHAIQLLDTETEGIANFHLVFLIQFSKHLGFFPNDNYSDQNKYFDMIGGCFEVEPMYHNQYLTPELSKLFHILMGLSFKQTARLQLNKNSRFVFLEKIIEYFQIHLNSLYEIKSHEVLKEVFDD